MQNRNLKAQAIVEAGLMSAIIVVFSLFNAYIPIFSFIDFIILPIPITLLVLRHKNYTVALGAVVSSTVIFAIFYNPILALVSGIMYGLSGIALGYCINNNISFIKTFLVLVLVSLLTYVANLTILSSVMFGGGVVEVVDKMMQTIRTALDNSKSMMTDQQQINMIDQLKQLFNTDVFLKMLPGAVLIYSFISAYVNYIITSKILKRFKYEMKDRVPFSRVYLNNRVGALLIIFICIGLILQSRGILIGDYISSSMIYVGEIAFLIDGTAVIYHFLRNRFKVNKPVAILILGMTILMNIGQIYLFIGFADMLIDFRKIDPNRLMKWKS